MPTPTPKEIELTQRVLRAGSYSFVEESILLLNDAQWAAQLEANERYAALEVRIGANKIKQVGSIQFFEPGSIEATLLEITKASRRRFGLPEITQTGGAAKSGSAPIQIEW
jgi:hypothetical protein